MGCRGSVGVGVDASLGSESVGAVGVALAVGVVDGDSAGGVPAGGLAGGVPVGGLALVTSSLLGLGRGGAGVGVMER